MAGDVGKVLCVHFSLSSPSGTLCVSGRSNQASWDDKQKKLGVSLLSKFCWPCWCGFTTGCQYVPTEMSVCHSGGLIVLPQVVFTYDFYYFRLSLYLSIPSQTYFPDITPLVHVAEHSDTLVSERSVFSATAVYLGWPHLEKSSKKLRKK